MRRVNFLIKFLVLISLHSSIKSEDENSRVNALLSDYFQWKIQTFAFDYYLKGFNENAGKLPDLSLDNFQRIKEKCGHFHDRADELLRQKVVENTRDLRYVKVLKREAQICSKGGKFHVSQIATFLEIRNKTSIIISGRIFGPSFFYGWSSDTITELFQG